MSETKRPKFDASDLLGMIEYEIRMLRFCLERLDKRPPSLADEDRWLYLEGFLLHYRNLIRFFSGKHNQPQKGDVSVEHQAFCRSLSADRVKWFKSEMGSLDDGQDNCDHNLISKRLQHCTEKRVELLGRKWPVSEMYKKIEPVLHAFEEDCLRRLAVSMTIGTISNDTVTRNPMKQWDIDSPLRRRND